MADVTYGTGNWTADQIRNAAQKYAAGGASMQDVADKFNQGGVGLSALSQIYGMKPTDIYQNAGNAGVNLSTLNSIANNTGGINTPPPAQVQTPQQPQQFDMSNLNSMFSNYMTQFQNMMKQYYPQQQASNNNSTYNPNARYWDQSFNRGSRYFNNQSGQYQNQATPQATTNLSSL